MNKILKVLTSPTTPFVIWTFNVGLFTNMALNSRYPAQLALNLGLMGLSIALAISNLRRRDALRDAEFVLKLGQESACAEGDQCCATDGHCEMEDAPDTEAKPEKKVC